MPETATEIRKQIIDLLNEAKIVSLPVVDNPMVPWEEADEIPSIGVYTQRTSPEVRSITSQMYRVTYHLAVQLICEADTQAEVGALLDNYEMQILRAVLGNSVWMSRYEQVKWVDTTKSFSFKDRLRGSVVCGFEITAAEYFEPAESKPFERIVTDIDIGQDQALNKTGWRYNAR